MFTAELVMLLNWNYLENNNIQALDTPNKIFLADASNFRTQPLRFKTNSP